MSTVPPTITSANTPVSSLAMSDTETNGLTRSPLSCMSIDDARDVIAFAIPDLWEQVGIWIGTHIEIAEGEKEENVRMLSALSQLDHTFEFTEDSEDPQEASAMSSVDGELSVTPAELTVASDPAPPDPIGAFMVKFFDLSSRLENSGDVSSASHRFEDRKLITRRYPSEVPVARFGWHIRTSRAVATGSPPSSVVIQADGCLEPTSTSPLVNRVAVVGELPAGVVCGDVTMFGGVSTVKARFFTYDEIQRPDGATDDVVKEFALFDCLNGHTREGHTRREWEELMRAAEDKDRRSRMG